MAHAFSTISATGLRAFVRRYRAEIQPYWPQLVLAFSALLGTVCLRLVEPWPMKLLFDQLLHKTSRPISVMGHVLSLQQIIWLGALATVFSIAARAFTEYIGKWLLSVVSNRVVNSVRVALFRRLLTQSLDFFAASRTGDLVLRMMSDVAMLRDVSTNAIVPLLVSALTFVSMWCVMFVMQWQLALAAFAVLPVFWFIALRTNHRIKTASRQQRARDAALAATVTESIGSIKLVQAMSLEARLASLVESQSGLSATQEIRSGKLSAALERSVDVFFAVASGVVLLFGMQLVSQDRISPGDLIVILAYLKRAFSPISDYAKYTTRIAKASAAAERVLLLQDAPVTESDAPNAVPAPRFEGHVEFQSVSFTYPGRNTVLNDLNLTISVGEIVAIIGPSGAGKSTLTDLLLRFLTPQFGRILVDGNDITRFTAASIRSQIDVVLQETILFAGTIRENLELGSPVTEQELHRTLKLACADGFVGALPLGVDTSLGERGATLSHGQRQRLALARAAIRNAPILILDEPTTGLDPDNRASIAESILHLAQGRATILITHDANLAQCATRILSLDNGRLCQVTDVSPAVLELAAGER